jgi:hypothetical protein
LRNGKVDFPQFIPHNRFDVNGAELTDRHPHFLARSQWGDWQRLEDLLFFDKLRVSLQIPDANEIGEKALIGFAAREIAAGADA